MVLFIIMSYTLKSKKKLILLFYKIYVVQLHSSSITNWKREAGLILFEGISAKCIIIV